MPIAYSYKRFSSDAQEGNDSIRRQTAAAQRFIDDHPEYGLVFDDNYLGRLTTTMLAG